MVCPVCHEPISEDMKFCGRCGTKIPRCPVCGKIIEKRMRFCLNDGTPLPEEILSVFPMDESAQTFQSEALPKQPVPLSLQEDGEPSAASPATEGGQKTVPLRESVGTDGWNTESGLAIDTQDAHPVAVQRFCLMCGQPCPPGAELCEACQDRIMAEELVTAKGGSNRTRRKRQRSRAVLIAVVLLLMLALVGSAAGYIAYGGAFRERFLIQKDDGIGPEESLEGNAVESAPSYGGVAAVERHDGGIEPETVPELETELETGSEPKEVAARETAFSEDIPTSEPYGNLEEDIRQIQNWYYNPGETERKITVPAGTDGWNDTREYSFHEEELYFAFFHQGGDNERRLYFKNGTLIRYIDETHTVYDEALERFRDWEIRALVEAARLVADETPPEHGTESASALGGAEESARFVLEGSDSRYISREELIGLSEEQCRLARNEIYARHGRIFASENLRAYFSGKDWYHPSIGPDDFTEDMLNSYETANRDLIVAYEKEMGYR